MSKRIGVHHSPDGSIDVMVPPSMAEEFKTLIKKATNCNPDMPVQIRDFADRLFQREAAMGDNMKWDLPAEDKYDLATNSPLSRPIAVVIDDLKE